MASSSGEHAPKTIRRSSPIHGPRISSTAEVLIDARQIVHNEFPVPAHPISRPRPPSMDPDVVASTPPMPSSESGPTDEELPDANNENEPPDSQSSTKENEAPAGIAARSTSVRSLEPTLSSQPPSSQPPPDSIDMQPGALPPDLLSLYRSSTRMLETEFRESPPHTLQRLAELVLRPKQHYRFLPAFLRALDRIVSVSSSLTDFPLLTHRAQTNVGITANGGIHANGYSETDDLGSDSSLGGALLTPIPWLINAFSAATGSAAGGPSRDVELHSESTETIEGPNGAGSIETVSVTVNGSTALSPSSAAHTMPQPTSPTLSEQSDASSSSSSGGMTEAQLREQGAVTQGELLRQEQEAGLVPLLPSQPQSSPRRSLSATPIGLPPLGPDASPASPAVAPLEDDELPHARGPEEIGVVDIGPHHGPGVEAAAVGLGRRASVFVPRASVPARQAGDLADATAMGDEAGDADMEDGKLPEVPEVKRDSDGDVVISDAD